MPDYYIGLISGTSMDGIDAALVEFGDSTVAVAHARTQPYPAELREQLLVATRQPDSCTVDTIGMLDHWIGECFRDAVLGLLDAADISPAQIRAIGSHGQTLRHRPDADRPFTLQIGNPAIIAKGAGITCVADFRSADIVLGGQGAPLVPLFHEWLFAAPDRNHCVLNIGGIANVTLLPSGDTGISGFDTGPGNSLLDAWTRQHRDSPYDESGQWAASGNCDESMLEGMLADPYFNKAPPKSTGFEYFNEDWLRSHVPADLDAADVQSTLCELTAASVSGAISRFAADTREVLVCGGGVHNIELMNRLGARLPQQRLASTAEHGLDPDWVEACAFAWLAMRTLNNEVGNAPGVTGASRAAVLGAIHAAI